MQQPTPNDITINVYDRSIELYLKCTPRTYNESHTPLLEFIDTSLSKLKSDATIFEVGSGPGRDAEYIKNKNFDLLCSDASPSFVKHLQDLGLNAIQFNVLKDNLSKKCDMIFANAVIPHFTPADLNVALKNIHTMLNNNGIFALTAKQGVGETWINEKFHEKRFVHYWVPQELIATLESNGFQVISLNSDIPGDLPSHTWILILAQKVL